MCDGQVGASKRIVAYTIYSASPQMAMKALRKAIMLRGRPAGSIDHCNFRSVLVKEVGHDPTHQRTDWLHDLRRISWQSGKELMSHAVLLRPTTKERPEPKAVDNTRRATHGNHHIDQMELRPQLTPLGRGKAHPNRVWSNLHASRTSGLNPQPGEVAKAGAIPLSDIVSLEMKVLLCRAAMIQYRCATSSWSFVSEEIQLP